MRFERLVLAAFAALCLLPISAPAGTPDAAGIVAIIDGSDDVAAAAAALKEAGADPVETAARLRGWKPATPPPGPGLHEERLIAPDGRETDLFVYVPKGYDGRKPFPLAVVLHGRGGDGRQMIELLSRSAERWSAILVAPSARKFKGMVPVHPHWWKHDEEGFAIQSLLWARRRFFVDDDRVLITGYSMGGFGTWNVGLRFPDRFSTVAPFAGGISQSEYLGGSDKRRRSLLGNAALVHLFFAHGSADPVVPVRFDRESHVDLEKAGIPHTYHEIEGGLHMLREVTAAAKGDFEKGWLVRDLFDSFVDTKRPAPSGRFTLTAIEEGATFRWVSIEKPSSFPCRVEGESSDSGFRITSEGVAGLAVWIDGTEHPAGGEIGIEWNGAEAFAGAVEPSLEAVVRSWKKYRDRRRVFIARILLDLPENGDEGF